MPLPSELPVKVWNGIEYVILQELSDVYRNKVGCSQQTDRNKIVVIEVCCNQYTECVEKTHFLELVQDLL